MRVNFLTKSGSSKNRNKRGHHTRVRRGRGDWNMNGEKIKRCPADTIMRMLARRTKNRIREGKAGARKICLGARNRSKNRKGQATGGMGRKW